MSSVVDVVVIGAGLAGLQTAWLLSEAGVSVRVVEARTRVGGRTHSAVHAAHTVELGGQWVAASHARVRKLCARHSLELEPQFDRGAAVLWLSHGAPMRFAGHVPPLPWHELILLQVTLWRLDALARRVATAAPWRSHQAGRLDHVSLSDWLERYVPLDAVRQCVVVAARSVFLEEAHNISLLWFLFEVRCAGSLAALLDVKGGAQELRLVRGAQSLSEALLRELRARRHVSVSLGSAVVRVAQYDADAAPVLVTLASGETLRARRVVGAISPQLTAKIAFEPPCERQHLGAHGMFSGNSVKFHLQYATPWWRAQGLSGEMVSNRPDVVVCCTFDASSASGEYAALLGFVSGDTARSFVQQHTTAEARRRVIEEAVRQLVPPGVAVEPAVAYHEANWCGEQFTDGCVNGTRPGGWLTRLRGVESGAAVLERPAGSTDISRPVGNVIWAGAECALQWNGYMEGALESAELAAKLVLEQLQATGGAAHVKLDGTELGELMKARRAPPVPAIGSAWELVYDAIDAVDEWWPRLRWPVLGGIAASAHWGAETERIAVQLCVLAALELLRWAIVLFAT